MEAIIRKNSSMADSKEKALDYIVQIERKHVHGHATRAWYQTTVYYFPVVHISKQT